MENLDSNVPPLDTPAPLESIDTPAPPDLPEQDESSSKMTHLDDVAVTQFETSLDKSEVPLTSAGGGGDASAQSAPLTEEDLLGGAEHTLDDQQLKADMIEANLEDIFK